MFDLLSDRLSKHLEQIVRERNPFFSSQGHFYVREYLRQELGNWGKVESHCFPFQGKVYENLILDLPNNSQKPPILIGAHYDTVPGSPGADDNATGLAVLLELARFFGENQANYPIRLIAFDLEEYGLLGSIAYAEKLNDDISLALVYAAADIFVAPSIEDNLPNTVMEALACATPSVAFKIGGMPDMIEHQENGYLAKPFEVEDLARGINWVLEDTERYNQLCIRARQKVEQQFTLELQAEKYLELYSDILSQSNGYTLDVHNLRFIKLLKS
jgi:glycosyltransferase involved in cell wall biosynthesis